MLFEAFLQNYPILQATFSLENPGNLHSLIWGYLQLLCMKAMGKLV
jgi:hypothetical protein